MATDRGLVGLGNAGESFDEFGRGRHYEDLNPAGFDARERVKVLDAEGIDVAVMYPGLGLKLGAIQDPDLAVESCKVYNDWLADWCAQAPDRLAGVGALPLQDPKRAADEARRIARLGLKAGFARPERVQRPAVASPFVHAGLGGAVGDRAADRVPSGRPRRHAGRVARARRLDGAGHAPRADPAHRPAADAVEPHLRRRARAVPRAEGDRARVRRRLDRALDGSARRVPRELRLGDAHAVADAARVLPASVLGQLRSRRAHRAAAVAADRRRPHHVGVRLPALRREVSRRRRRAARVHRGNGRRRARRAVRPQRGRRCTRCELAGARSSSSPAARVVDGTGAPPRTADVAIANGRGRRGRPGRRERAPRAHRRRRPARDARLRRHPHALRRAAALGPDRVARVVARRHHADDGQLRLHARAEQARGSRVAPADAVEGRRHERRRAARRRRVPRAGRSASSSPASTGGSA